MNDSSFVPDGYCGLYCASCPVFQATESGEIKNWEGVGPCKGCKSATVSGWCAVCNLKSCAREKGHEFCYECSDYPCQNLENFKNDPQYPYHTEVYDYMKIIEEKGREAWLAEMETRWSCPSCGERMNWWTVKCDKCGSDTNGYVQPPPKEEE